MNVVHIRTGKCVGDDVGIPFDVSYLRGELRNIVEVTNFSRRVTIGFSLKSVGEGLVVGA